LTFGVTWRHRSRDHSTPHVGFPIGGQWSPSVYLARLLRYSAWKIMGSRPWPLGSRDVIGHVTIRLPMSGSHRWSVVTIRLSGTVIEIFSPEDIGVTTLTFCGHVTLSVTWPFDSPWGVSYRWSKVTRRLSGTVNEIFSLEDNGATTLTFGVKW